MLNGIATLKYSGLFLPRDKSETLVAFDDTSASTSEPSDIYYTQAGIEEAAKNYDAQGNQAQAAELRLGLEALIKFRTKHDHNH